VFQSWRVGRWLGIDVFVHPTFWLLPLFVLLTGSPGDALATELATLFAVFGCVLLHEYGHAVAAMGFGVRTRDITLYPVGGVASLDRMPERPVAELVIALAGPAVNVAIAGALGFALLLDPGLLPQAFVANLLAINVGLVLFNLLPAFPMDGGRVLRAVLATGLGRLRATEVAVGVGTVVTLAMAAVGVLVLHSLTLPMVAGLAFLMGQAELAAVREDASRRRWRREFTGYEHDPATGDTLEYVDGRLVRVWRGWRV
jgi:Zn-dependent protease